VAGGLRRALAGSAAVTLAAVGALLLAFPRVMAGVLAAAAFWGAAGLGWYVIARRRRRDEDDAGTAPS
jgi:hypothetical protein